MLIGVLATHHNRSMSQARDALQQVVSQLSEKQQAFQWPDLLTKEEASMLRIAQLALQLAESAPVELQEP